MTYQSKWDTVAGEIEERKILEIEKYGFVMTTHRFFFEKGSSGRLIRKQMTFSDDPRGISSVCWQGGVGI